MSHLSKKSEAGLVIILVVIILVFFFGWLINISQRECKTNRDCGDEAYCGSDFSCHTYPPIQKTVVQYNLLWPSIILGIAIIAVALIFNWDKIRSKEKEVHNIAKHKLKEPEEVEEITEPYYKTDAKIRTP